MKNKTYEVSEETFTVCKNTLHAAHEQIKEELKSLIKNKHSRKEDVDGCMETSRLVGEALKEMEKLN